MFIRQIFKLLLLFAFVACNERQQSNPATLHTSSRVADTVKHATIPPVTNPFGFDTAFEISKQHARFMVTAYLNTDNLLDTAVLIRHKLKGKDALFIKHSATASSFLLKSGKDVGIDFDDFNWVGQFEVIKKGTTIWNNVINGEIVNEHQVPDSNKIRLKNDGIFIHEDEGGGGGIIYFKNEKYVCVQQD